MRLPWLQIDQEAFERAVELAAILEVEESQAMGHLVWLWRWSLSRPADHELTGSVCGPTAIAQIEAGARWRGARGALVGALIDLGLMDPEPGGQRVKGLERYREQLQKRAQERERKALWESARKERGTDWEPTRKERGADAEGTRKERRADAEVQRQTQTQTQTQTQNDRRLPLSAEPPADRGEVVFEHWRKVMGKNARTAFDAKRRKAVEARLVDGYTVEDLCRAVDGCALTPHNMGQNDRNERFDDIELICRDAAHVDRFRATAAAAGPPEPTRVDREALAEAKRRGAAVDPQLPKLLEGLRWRADGPLVVGVCPDGVQLGWLEEMHGEALRGAGLRIEGEEAA